MRRESERGPTRTRTFQSHRPVTSRARPSRKFGVWALALLLSGWPLPNRVKADAGDLDLSFGSGGRVTTDFLGSPGSSFTADQINDIAIQSDGKIVAAGADFSDDFAIARYNSDGGLDTGFGSGGKVTRDFLGNRSFACAIAIQPDGAIVVGGYTLKAFDFSTSDFVLARYNADGSLDTSFGSGGTVITDFFGADDLLSDIVLQGDGKIIAVGSSSNLQPGRVNVGFAVARYDSNGGLDASFGIGGMVTTNFFGNADQAYGVALQSNGKVVVAGATKPAGVGLYGTTDFALSRYNTDGSLDSGFGSDGKATTDFLGGSDIARDVVIQGDGKIVLAGRASDHTGELCSFALSRYDKNGALDSNFGSAGKVITPSYQDGGNALTIQADGKLVVVGSTYTGSTFDFAVMRYNTNGMLDSSFGANGKVTTDFFTNYDSAAAVAAQRDGKIIVAGTAHNASLGYDFALARYESGIPIPSITSASVEGKKLAVVGENFGAGAQILINGQSRKTKNDPKDSTRLIAKKAGYKVRSGDILQVRNPNGIISAQFTYP